MVADLSWQAILILVFCALGIGGDKAGLRGITVVVIPFFASRFGGKSSASIVLPLLLLGDCFSVFAYRKNIEWSFIKKLFPATLTGLFAGMFAGYIVSDRNFMKLMAILVFICLILMVYKEFSSVELRLAEGSLFHRGMGFGGGFSTMVGNAAGPIMSLYFLSANLPKLKFIGTGAAFFLGVNLLKLPVHIFLWKSLNFESFKISLMMMPFLILGFFLGLLLVKKIPERPFRIFVILAAFAGAFKLLI